ncbi:MAG: 5'-nucleotidase, partial [Myxococcota bacterium]
ITALDEFILVTPDAGVVLAIDAFASEVDVLAMQEIGTIAENLCLARFPGTVRGTLCTVDQVPNGSDISNVVAKAFMTVTPTADVGIQNGGGVRVEVPAGPYTIADAYTLLPFSNTLVTLEMTGQEIKDVLEDALANRLDDGGSDGSYPYASGLRWDVDATQPEDSRISNLEINSRLEDDWAAIDMGATYVIVTNNFIASGRDGYDAFAPIFADESKTVDTFTEYAQGFINYIELVGTLSKLPFEEYSTQSYIAPAD